MSVTNLQHTGHSAHVRMELCVNGLVLSIAQLGLDFLLLDQPLDHPPSDAEITVSVDGRIRRRRVYLPDGIAADNRRTRIAGCR